MNRGTPIVMFVCTGNVCRSPMAEFLFRKRLGDAAPWRVSSAGVAAIDGMSASASAIMVMAEQDVDLTPHRSRRLTAEMVDHAFMLVVMTAEHMEAVIGQFPIARDKVYLLSSFSGSSERVDIEDPIGSTIEFYRRTRDAIALHLPGLQEFLSGTIGGHAPLDR